MSNVKDLRTLMRERLNAQKRPKIDSPLARYDSKNNLFCVICDIQIKSENFWSAHLLSKAHKEKFEEIKRNKRNVETTSKTLSSLKRPSSPESDTAIPIKSQKIAHSENKNKNEVKDEIKPKEAEEQVDVKIKELDTANVNTPNVLPEGFFDDPVEDAKARNQVYKDPLEDEMERFKKAMEEEISISESKLNNELEDMQEERNLFEIEEQIYNWSKVEEMQKKIEQLKTHLDDKEILDVENDEVLDLEEIDVFANWRNKATLKKKIS